MYIGLLATIKTSFKLYETEARGQFLKKILSPLVILSMEKTMVTKVISELKSISRLKILPETGPRSQILNNE